MAVIGKAGGGTFITGPIVHSITKSKYGNQAISNSTRELKNALYFAVYSGISGMSSVVFE